MREMRKMREMRAPRLKWITVWYWYWSHSEARKHCEMIGREFSYAGSKCKIINARTLANYKSL